MQKTTDPEIAAALIRRAAIFKIVERLRHAGGEISSENIKKAMQSEPESAFESVDFAWVETTLTRRLPDASSSGSKA